jgi:hypothetical protein
MDSDIPKKYLIAMEIVESEEFLWLMAGSNHIDIHLQSLKPAYKAWQEAGGKSVLHKDYGKNK